MTIDRTLTCPNGQTEPRLTGSLAAPLTEAPNQPHDPFTLMNEGLFKEKQAVQKPGAKREEQITRKTEVTVGMYGELQGIAGEDVRGDQRVDDSGE